MPRDQRLYMTFPIDFDEHPKVEGLSDAAFRAFVSMNGYCRRQGLDGVVPTAVAHRRWGESVMRELVDSHAERPLVLLDGQVYVIRHYSEHQLTTTDIEDLRAKRAAAGAKGGKSRALAQARAKQVPRPLLSNPEAVGSGNEQAESRETSSKTSMSQSSSNRARVSTDAIQINPMTKKLADQIGVTSLRAVVDAAQRHCGVSITADQAYQLGLWLLEKRDTPPDAPQRWVLSCFEQTPAEIQQHIYESMAVA